MDRLEFKATWAVDDAGAVSGLAAVFGTADHGGDVLHKGAFAGARAPLPMLASHDPADVVGVWESLVETAEGLAVKGRLLVGDVVRAAEVRALMLAGAMAGLSIGYIATKKAPRTGGGRDLITVDLKEISIVAVPMHPGARVTSVKALEVGKAEMTLEEMQAELAKLEKKHADALSTAVAAAVAPYVQRLDKMEAKANRPGGDLDATKEPTLEQKAFRSYLQRGNLAGETELKALMVSSDPNGGYLAPAELSAEVLKDLVDLSPVRAIASIRGTNAPSVIYPTRKPMGNATWLDEQEDETETSTTNIFGSIEVQVKGMATFLDATNQLLQDAPQAEVEVRTAFAEDFALKESLAFVKGNGIAAPEGIMTNANIASVNMGHATVIQPDALVKFLYSFSPSYRDKGVWFCNGTTLGLLMTMKDGQGNYLWRPSYQAGQPATLLGRPVVELPDMPDVAADAFPIGYGDFSGYRILDRLSLSILVDPYTLATKQQTRIHATRRVGGRVIQPIKFKKLKMAV